MNKEEVLKVIDILIDNIDYLLLEYSDDNISNEVKKLFESKSLLYKLYVAIDNNKDVFMSSDGKIKFDLDREEFIYSLDYFSYNVILNIPNRKLICRVPGFSVNRFIFED